MSLKVVVISTLLTSAGHHRDTAMTSNQQRIGALKSKTSEKAVASSPVEDEEDTMSYFARLAEED